MHILNNENICIILPVIVSQTVQGHGPDRICILVHRGQGMRIIFMNMHYNCFVQGL